MAQKAETSEPVTLGHIRSHGCRNILIYCGSINCSHSVIMNAACLMIPRFTSTLSLARIVRWAQSPRRFRVQIRFLSGCRQA